jgi:[ribosomal protein S18]-alanine N-acetyltransferase
MSAVFVDSAADFSSPSISYRAMRDNDIAAVAMIEQDVYVFPWSAGNFRDSLLSGYQCWGCWVGSELIGYAIILVSLDEAHLLNFAVSRHWQNQGVGARFLTFVISESKRMGCEMLYLEVRPSNAIGRRLYDRFGFQQLGLRRNYYPATTGREDALFLGLNISPPKL